MAQPDVPRDHRACQSVPSLQLTADETAANAPATRALRSAARRARGEHEHARGVAACNTGDQSGGRLVGWRASNASSVTWRAPRTRTAVWLLCTITGLCNQAIG